VTGFSDVLADLSGKYVQFALELGKQPTALHYLWHNGWADGQNRLQATERAAQSAGVKLRPVAIAGVVDADDAMAAMKRAGAATVIVQPSPLTFQQRERLAAVALKHQLATIFAFPPAAREGALMAYGPDYGDLYRRAGALRQPHSQGQQAGGSSRRGAREVRAGRQPQNRAGPGPHHPPHPATAGNRDHPISHRVSVDRSASNTPIPEGPEAARDSRGSG
jgi:hypothetical protein